MIKEIKGLSGYFVSENGDVYSLKQKTLRKLKVNVNGGGYPYVVLSVNGKVKTVVIHRIVAITFIPNPNGLRDVNHKDCDKTNNNVSNLEWCTHSQNLKHAFSHGITALKFEENHRSAKLTKKDVLEIKNKYIPRIYSTRKLAKEYGVTHQTIMSIIRNQSWKKV